MFPSFIVSFREILEVAIIVGVVLAATTGVEQRARWIWLGIAGGVLGSAVVAAFTESISNFASGIGQELFNALVVFTAAIIIGWTAIWMRVHARHVVAKIRSHGSQVLDGSLPKYTLSFVIALAVLREGAEIVLFTYGMLASGQPLLSVVTGSFGGMLAGAFIGFLLYIGILTIPSRYIFQATTWLLLLLASGMSSLGAKYLSAAGYFSQFSTVVWDMSSVLPEKTILGQLLHALFGYSEQPVLIQIIFYFATLGVFTVMITLTQRYSHHQNPAKNAIKAAAITLLLATSCLGFSQDAQAAKQVYSPYVEQGEWELEWVGDYAVDSNDDVDGGQHHKLAVGYGVTHYWATEINGVFEKEGESGSSFILGDVEWENRFQLTEPGQYFVDVGLYAAYEATLHNDEPDNAELQLLLAKDVGPFTHYANIEYAHEVGSGASDANTVELKWSSRYRYNQYFMPGFEVYSEFGDVGNGIHMGDHEQQIGPVFYGDLTHGFKYELGYLFGASSEAPDGEAKWLLEYEMRF